MPRVQSILMTKRMQVKQIKGHTWCLNEGWGLREIVKDISWMPSSLFSWRTRSEWGASHLVRTWLTSCFATETSNVMVIHNYPWELYNDAKFLLLTSLEIIVTYVLAIRQLVSSYHRKLSQNNYNMRNQSYDTLIAAWGTISNRWFMIKDELTFLSHVIIEQSRECAGLCYSDKLMNMHKTWYAVVTLL